MNHITKKATAATVAVALGLSAAAISPASASELDAQGIETAIVQSNRDAAVAAIEAAMASGLDADDLKKATKNLENGDEKAAEGKWEDAEKKYEKAVKYAAKAVEKAAKKAAKDDGKDDGNDAGLNAAAVVADAGGYTGKWSAYEFTFYNLATGETHTVLGNNLPDNPLGQTGASNEGFIAVGDDILMLHVSCSDAFTEGVGQKSDPSIDSDWRVIDFVITKYSGSEADKTCPLSGNFTPPETSSAGEPVPEPIEEIFFA